LRFKLDFEAVGDVIQLPDEHHVLLVDPFESQFERFFLLIGVGLEVLEPFLKKIFFIHEMFFFDIFDMIGLSSIFDLEGRDGSLSTDFESLLRDDLGFEPDTLSGVLLRILFLCQRFFHIYKLTIFIITFENGI
jgi:hypothetical protein